MCGTASQTWLTITVEGKMAYILTITVELEEKLVSGSAFIATVGMGSAFHGQLPPTINIQSHSIKQKAQKKEI